MNEVGVEPKRWRLSDGVKLLDGVYQDLLDGSDVTVALPRLLNGLWGLRQALPRDVWKVFAQEYCRNHSIQRILQEDPLTAWSRRKPRGYPGDAVLLDLIYGGVCVSSEVCAATSTGRAIYEFLNALPGAHAIRGRLGRIVATIDHAAMQRGSPSILAVACGHLREADYSLALQGRLIGTFLAVDQDSRSLEVVKERYRTLNISTLQCSVFELLKGDRDLGRFNLVYVVGLYDYLTQAAANRLTSVLFDHLYPQGEMLIANALTDVPYSAYMEACMDWHLIYRTPEELEATTASVPSRLIQEKELSTDRERVFGYLRIKRGDA